MTTHADFSPTKRMRRICLLAICIGVASFGLAWILLKLIYFFTNLCYHLRFSAMPAEPTLAVTGNWAALVPVAGGLVVGSMAYYGSERIRGHGIPEALEAIMFGRSRIDLRVALLKPLSSAISIGSGGPFGAEGPIIMTGGAFGSLIAQNFNLTSAERKTLLVAGAAGGMSATFGTPLAAALLAVELLLFEWKPRSIIPVMLASATAGCLRPLLFGGDPLFPVPPHEIPGMRGMAIAVLAGLLAGCLAWLVTTAVYKWEELFRRLPVHWVWWPAIGGLVVGLAGLVEPQALGVGYGAIAEMLRGDMLISAVLALLVVKILIWSCALGSGTSGGVLAPLLTFGAALGVLVAAAFHTVDPSIWPLVCMAAVMGGVLRSPFTSIVFALEVSHDINALLPVMIASAVAYFVSVMILRRSIMTEKIARRGRHIFYEYSVDPLERFSVGELMTKQVDSLSAELPVAEFLEAYIGPQQKHRGYPVVDEHNAYIGMLSVTELLDHAGDAGISDIRLSEFVARGADPVCFEDEPCRVAAVRMVRHGVERMAVIHEGDHSLVGIISRSDMLKPSIQYYEQEEVRERVSWWRNGGGPAS